MVGNLNKKIGFVQMTESFRFFQMKKIKTSKNHLENVRNCVLFFNDVLKDIIFLNKDR